MDCVNHRGVAATAYCQNCGKPLCPACVRNAGNGQVLCEPCLIAWQNAQQPFVAAASGPNPSTAAVLGIIPGVGAMYNGQYFKGLIHVVIFVVIISITTHYGLFGLFIPAWILYQAFEAYHTAKALREGMPLPDPLGLNEVGNWLNLGGPHGGQPGAAGQPPQPGAPAQPGSAAGVPPAAGSGYQQAPYTQYQAPYTGPGVPGAAAGPGYVPPNMAEPPVPPVFWRRKEPIGALILIGFGLLLLLNEMGILAEHVFRYLWPLIFIALGVWLIFRRLEDTKGGRP